MMFVSFPRKRAVLMASAALAVLALAPPALAAADEDPAATQVEGVVVTASTVDLLGKAVTASQGAITRQELELRPVYRVGQLLETIPGLTVTVHSGEGKANQFLLRGVNLDHGTDLATYVDGMPVNMRTHTHGQGYTDLNFLIPELAGGIDFTKGPYFAAEGDFAAVGANHIRLADRLEPQLTASVGTLGDQRLFVGGGRELGPDSRLVTAAEFVHLDGPWDHPDNYRKTNLAARYEHGGAEEGWSLTGLYYRGLWNATTDQPRRAVEAGLIGRFGTLDTTDGGQAERFSLSGQWRHVAGDWRLTASGYVVRQQLTLWNNFTHFLEDPVHGDQHAQNDRRTFAGGAFEAARDGTLAGRESRTRVGVQGRFDDIYVDLRHTQARADLETQRADQVREASIGVYAENILRWTSWLRTVVGAREDYVHVRDRALVGGLTGSEAASIFQPKASLVLSPWRSTEVYVSAGRGFHSNDGRAGLVDDGQGGQAYERPPLLVRSKGYEIGLRTSAVPHLTASVTAFQTDFDSELVYNADAGQTEAGRPSRRRGVEVSLQYRPAPWVELNSNIALSRARYRDDDPAGRHVEDAPSFVGGVGARVDNLGPWFGAIQWRALGAHALVEDNSIRSPGYREVNLNVGYKVGERLRVQVDVFNLANSHANAADYFYEDRISPTEQAQGDIHSHPLEPRSARLSATWIF